MDNSTLNCIRRSSFSFWRWQTQCFNCYNNVSLSEMYLLSFQV